ncbi:nuclear transport factor 2 family protein [Aldersonia sp. NBC_00410]|uniref:nuclear transport factor 2 family protein n=1 Tax=Aldersonia sp. NBC_00410 TaxID=2975954 RepID=UPI0022557503|nr:nuclear transport factor 2 family protein [Aldersonia sp. NBC_00410]MCX5042374.1 nuclear transport factor 2 family protein [Aldersonia sp. NBC_00410]
MTSDMHTATSAGGTGRLPVAATHAAFLSCQQIIADSYARADAGRRASVAELFVEDGWQRLGPILMQGRARIREVMATRDDDGRRTLHTTTDLRITAAPRPDELHLSYHLTLYVLSGERPCIPDSLAAVTDVFVRRNEQWCLQSRDLSLLAPTD